LCVTHIDMLGFDRAGLMLGFDRAELMLGFDRAGLMIGLTGPNFSPATNGL
jgi:hypothetical protein